MSVIKITKDNFEDLKNSDKLLLVDFYADWCGPCRMMSPIIDEIADERGDISVGKINVDDEPQLAMQYDVTTIPTLMIIKGGDVCERIVGVRPKAQLISLIDASIEK